MDTMTRQSDKQLREQLQATRETLKDNDTFHDIDIIDVHIVKSLNGGVREVALILTTGGPHIKLQCGRRQLEGYWSGSEESLDVSDVASDLCEAAFDYYESMEEGF